MTAHQRWQGIPSQEEHRALIRRGQAMEVAARAVRIESRIFILSELETRFTRRCEVVAKLPR
jgi:hypothetical protein